MTIAEIPVLNTARLVLRPLAESDLDDFSAMLADERVYRWLGGQPATRVESWRNLAMHLGHWSLRGYGMWALEEQRTGRFVGRAGLWFPEGWPGMEVGWTVAPEHWGNGYATEAGAAALTYAFQTLDRDEVCSVTLPHNIASRRVMTKLGMAYDRTEQVGGVEQVVHRISAAQWRARA